MFAKYKKLREFSLRESGNATVEFVFMLPLFVIVFVSTFEVGMAMTRLTMLEHGLDSTMRVMRLSTGQDYDHNDVRDMVCDNAGILKDCKKYLQVELVRIDPDDWVLPADFATCVDRASNAEPVVTFRQGSEAKANDIMHVRVCYAVDPFYPTIGLGSLLETDDTGAMHLVASSAFAQEPE